MSTYPTPSDYRDYDTYEPTEDDLLAYRRMREAEAAAAETRAKGEEEKTMPTPRPPIHCAPCRVRVGDQTFRVYADGSVSASLTEAEARRLGLPNVKAVLDYERTQLQRLLPHSTEAKTIRREASRLRRNRNARERSQAMRDLGYRRTAGGWE